MFGLSFDFLTVFDDWYTVGTLLVQQCTNSVPILSQAGATHCSGKRIGTLLVHCWSNSVPTVYQSSKSSKKTVKNSHKTVKTVPIVTCLHRVRRIYKVRVRVRVRLPNTQSLSKYRVHKCGNGRTKGHVENIMPRVSLDWRMHENTRHFLKNFHKIRVHYEYSQELKKHSIVVALS